MRIRSIKPEFWRSDDIAALTWDDRLIFVGLWSYVDDNGVGIDRLASITADLFSGDLESNPPETFARLSRGLQNLSEAGRIVRYTVAGKAYLEIVNWAKHQRIDKPNKPRFPRSDTDGVVIREGIARVTAKESSGTGEQGNRGTEEQRKENPSSEIAEAIVRPDVAAVLDALDDRLRANGLKLPKRNRANVSAARLLIDRDGKTVEQITRAIDWATNDEFWRANILSMSKLREKYDQLALAATRKPGSSVQRSQATALDLQAHYQEEEARAEIGSR